MKKLLFFTALVALFWIGCAKKSNTNNPETTENTNTNTMPDAPETMKGQVPYFPFLAQGDTSKLVPLDSSKVQTTPSGLKFIVLERGTGDKPKPGDKIIANYHGILTNGKRFDSSYLRKQPFEFQLSQPGQRANVIQGWDEGFRYFNYGGTKAILIIPPNLGYGAQGSGTIPGNSTLIFYVELIGKSN